MSTLQLRLVPFLARTLKLQNGCRMSAVYRLPQHKYKTKTTSFSPNYRKFNSIANNNNIYRQNSATTSLLLVSTQGANRWFRRSSHYDKWTNLCFEDMEALISCGDIQLFDVREPKEILDTGKIPCAINIPFIGQQPLKDWALL
ncbi:uncharacterized protein LOC106868364 isoform X1 [Octopus bimaculoides]|nr:uncharacterized protein LOC106868364 isoform X1 [Octopus bimaculoides]|eukprot:XP_014769066.1 PREDICTED: uncharacterized protein LOC106868364 isoform X1 [Octopus bimaculoides]